MFSGFTINANLILINLVAKVVFFPVWCKKKGEILSFF